MTIGTRSVRGVLSTPAVVRVTTAVPPVSGVVPIEPTMSGRPATFASLPAKVMTTAVGRGPPVQVTLPVPMLGRSSRAAWTAAAEAL
jgi:hypothetical protein